MQSKAALRAQMRARLDAQISDIEKANLFGCYVRLRYCWQVRRLNTRLRSFLRPMGPQNLAAYYPMPGELTLLPLMKMLHMVEGWQTALPCIPENAADRCMRFCRWIPGAPTHANRFGIREPATQIPLPPSIVLVPLVAFDRRGGRLGYGKGYYDTTLADLMGQDAHCLRIGIAYDFQEVDRIPNEAHDMPLDYVVTPTRLIQILPSVTQS